MNTTGLRKIVAAFIVVIWLFVVVTGYYIAHKPFGLENVLALLNVLGDVGTAIVLYALASVLGRRLLNRYSFASPLENIVITSGVGLGVIAFTTFAMGLVGWLNPILFWGILLVALVVLQKDLRRRWETLLSIRLPRETRFETWLVAFVVFGLGAALLFAVCPPIGWDGLQYHLVGPKLAITQGRITVPPDNLSLNFPALIEMLFLAAMQLKGDSAAQVMHWGYLLLLLGAVLAFAQRYFTTQVGWLAAAILVAVPSVMTVSTWAYNDLALAFYGTVALFLALRARETLESRWFALSGVFVGLAMGEKYTAGFLGPILCLLTFRSQRQGIKQVLVLGISAAIVAAPWFIRNWILVGNPVYPFVWGGLYWDTFRAAWYSRFGTGLWNEPWRLLSVPWEATIIGSEQVSEYQATIGALLLAFIPLGWLVPRSAERSNVTRVLWFFVGALYLVWLVGVAQSKLLSQTRLLFPAFPALALLAADSFKRLEHLEFSQFSVRRFAGLVVGLVLTLTAVSYGLSITQGNPFAYILGFESRDKYLAGALGEYYSVAGFINHELPANVRVLSLWETRPYYIDRAITEDAILDRWAHFRFLFRDSKLIAEHLRREGYTHLLLYRAGLDHILQAEYDPITSQDVAALQDLLNQNGKQIYGKTPLQIVSREGKLAILNADSERYAMYELHYGSLQ